MAADARAHQAAAARPAAVAPSAGPPPTSSTLTGAIREPTRAAATMTLSLMPSTVARTSSATTSCSTAVAAASTLTAAAPAIASGTRAHPIVGAGTTSSTPSATSSSPRRIDTIGVRPRRRRSGAPRAANPSTPVASP